MECSCQYVDGKVVEMCGAHWAAVHVIQDAERAFAGTRPRDGTTLHEALKASIAATEYLRAAFLNAQ